MDIDEKYHHVPIPDSISFRVLKLSPTAGITLNCEIITVSLVSPPSYEALSYAWDAQAPTHPITCNGKSLFITANCEAALRRLRPRFVPRTLWIDSICIDQTSVLERNQQVKHIGEIYGKSSRVVVWLGESTLQSDITLKYLDKMYYAYGAYNTDKDGQVLHLIRQFEGVLPVVERQNLC